MRGVCAALPLSIVVALCLSSAAMACGDRVSVRGGCVRHVRNNVGGEKARAEREIEEMKAAARQEIAAMKAQAEQGAGGEKARAEREIEQMKAAARQEIAAMQAQAEQHIAAQSKETATLKAAAVELQELLNGKIAEANKSIETASRREREAEKTKQEADAEMAQAKALEAAAQKEIEITQAERKQHQVRFNELLNLDPCGPGARRAERPGS